MISDGPYLRRGGHIRIAGIIPEHDPAASSGMYTGDLAGPQTNDEWLEFKYDYMGP